MHVKLFALVFLAGFSVGDQNLAGFHQMGTYTGGNGIKTYYLKKKNEDWYNAQEQCLVAGLESLSLDNEEEKDHFFNLIANDNQVNTLKFISLGGLQLGNDYVWLNNYQKFNYPIPWSPREPSGPCKAEHCMCIEIISKKVVGFNNYGCSTLTLPFFCQSAKTGTVTPNFKSNESVEDSQLCQAITNTLNSAKENEDNKIINSTEVTNSGSRKYKTTTISVSTTEYEY